MRPDGPGMAASGHGRLPAAVLAMAVASAAPLALYFLVRPHVAGDATALAIATAGPAAATAATALWRRQVRLLGALTVVGLGAAVAATVAADGSSLPLKLYRPLFTGAVGLALLASAALRRPLLSPALRLLAGAATRRAPGGPGSGQLAALRLPARTAMAGTVVLGAAFVAEAATTVLLAFTVSTATFLIASRLVRIATAAALLAAMLGYRRQRRRAMAPRPAVAPQPSMPPQPAVAPQPAPSGTPARRPWFAPRWLGPGIGRPQTWQGWLVVAVVIAVIVAIRLARQ